MDLGALSTWSCSTACERDDTALHPVASVVRCKFPTPSCASTSALEVTVCSEAPATCVPRLGDSLTSRLARLGSRRSLTRSLYNSTYCILTVICGGAKGREGARER